MLTVSAAAASRVASPVIRLCAREVAELVEAVDEERDTDDDAQRQQRGVGGCRGIEESHGVLSLRW
jgi:hypothetical protein